MDLALWILQIIVAVLFAVSGYGHTLGYERLKARAVWLAAIPRWFAAVIGSLELAGAVGVVVPAATHVAAWLTPLAALLFAILMAFAIVFHTIRHESRNIATNAVLGILAALVAYGRYVLVPLRG